MKTEITENTAGGWVFYDGRCAMCNRQVKRWKETFAAHGFTFVPQQADWVQQRLGLSNGRAADEMKVLTGGGLVKGGFDAVLYLAAFIWWARPAVVVARIPGVFHLLRALYRQIAKRRYCLVGKCGIQPYEPHR